MLRQLLLILSVLFTVPDAAAQVLRVGLSPDYPPLVHKREGKLVGIELDNARAAGEIMGRELQPVEMPFAGLLPALQAGEIDIIMSGMSITAARSELVSFSDPYMQVGQMAIVHRNKVARYAQPWAVYRDGVRIGVEPETTGAEFAQSELTDARVKFYTDPPAAFAGLRNDEIDLYIHDAPTSWQLANSMANDDLFSLYHPLTDERLAWAVRRDDEALLEELNRALRMMQANGTLQYILNRWIPVRVTVP